MNDMIDASTVRHWFMHTPHAAIGMGGNAKARPAPRPEAEDAERRHSRRFGIVLANRSGTLDRLSWQR